MKIKVVTVKEIFKYLAKITVVFGMIAIFAKFFYTNKNINNCFAFNSSKCIATIKKEILLLREDENINIKFQPENYISSTLNNEFSMFKAVATTNLTNTKLGNSEDNINNVGGETINIDSQQQAQNSNDNTTELEEAKTGVNVEVIPSNIPDKNSYEIFGVKLRNESSYNLSDEITDLNIELNKQDIMIFHTHTCESYTPTEQYQYDATGTFRTTDLNYTVSRVGDELEKYLVNYGYTVVHDKTYHDYPAYTGSYNRSLVTVQNLLSTYQNTDVVID